MSKNIVTTKGGKNKDQYGRKFGKKHNEAMMEFTKNLWLQDAVASLRYLLQNEQAQQAFMNFLKTEYGEAQLEFYVEAQKLESMDSDTQAKSAIRIYSMFMSAGGKGIGQQERTASTQEMWDRVNTGGGARGVDGNTALQKIRDEADSTLKMLAFDAFPRFIKSPHCKTAIDAIKSAGNGAQIEGMLQNVDSKTPQDADDWLNMFVATAESFPACIVISDMTIPGAPMVFVNSEFCRTTGYTREEAVGRNCRFLQGPETEPEAIQVIRNTLSKGQDCHVKLTNYRKNGELFQNLLSMRPVFDADNIYRYVIGVQFEIKEDDNLKQRLVQLDKLLRLLPSKLPFRSKASARAKGALAVKTSGEANQMIGNKDQILAQTKQLEMQEQNANRPKVLGATPMEVPMSNLNLDNTVFAFTKILWLHNAKEVMQSITLDPLGKESFDKFVKTTAAIYQTHYDFVCKFAQVASAQGQEQLRLIRKFHLKKNQNSLFYCTTTEINYGNLNQTNWGPIFQEMGQRQQQSIALLATELLPRFFNSKLSQALVSRVRARELTGQQGQLRTAAIGLDKNSDSFWMDMFKVLAEAMTIGVVISDMTIPGAPLVYINEGFRNVTGYDKSKIGTSCRFLQGPETESYLNDEIMAALQQAEPLVVKLHNYKANGQKFQCLLALHPVMGVNKEYKFQVGFQIDFQANPDITRQLLEMERLIRYMPHSITGEDSEDMGRIMPTDLLGDSTVFPYVKVDPSEVKAVGSSTATSGGAFSSGFGGGSFGGGFGAPANPITSGVAPKGAEVMAQGKEVVTKKGKNKDQYGRSFGKKQKAAMLEFTKTLWLQDSTTSLRNLLQQENAQQAFMSFLKLEYGEAQLEFYLEAQQLEILDPVQQAAAASQIYNMFMTAGGKGIGQQERTKATQQMWDYANQKNDSNIEGNTALKLIREEAETTLKMLAFDAFPRFVKSKQCTGLLENLKLSGNGAQIEGLLQNMDSKSPQDADDWLNMFVATAESFPACIVISDMTIPGAPMVFVNSEFCKTTGYSREEAVGRNCRFLQGPETEPEAIQVIRNTLSKGQDCHVKLTNYRKNGELFQNLLSMRPVFDADNIYRYVIGVQFEIKEDDNLKKRLVQLDKLLRLLPSKLPLKSKASARAKGAMAVKTSGEANQMIGNKEQLLAQAKQQELQEMTQTVERPKALVSMASYDPKSLNYDRTIAAFTKIMWLSDPIAACRSVLIDSQGMQAVKDFAEGNCGLLVQFHLKFFEGATQVRLSQGAQQAKRIRALHMKKQHNAMFYCANTEIDYGTLNTMNWGPIFETMCKWQEQSTIFLAQDTFARFLEHSSSNEYISKLRQRELAGEQLPVRSAAYGVNPQSESFWLDMFQNVAETVSIGMVISDMTIPGIPLVYINEGFRNVTGYGKEKIGTSCRFLQGKETESYLNDEIMAALQQAEPLVTKLHNYKANGQKFQCLLALHPVFGPAPDNEYKFQIGLQLDFNGGDQDLSRKVAEMTRVLRLLPQAVGGEKLSGVDGALSELDDYVRQSIQGSSGGNSQGMSMGGGYAGAQQAGSIGGYSNSPQITSSQMNMGMGAPPQMGMGMGMGAPPQMSMGMGAPPQMGMGMGAPQQMGMGMGAPPQMGMGMGAPQMGMGGRSMMGGPPPQMMGGMMGGGPSNMGGMSMAGPPNMSMGMGVGGFSPIPPNGAPPSFSSPKAAMGVW